MKYIFNQDHKNETIILIKNEIGFERIGNQLTNPTKYYTIVWNRGNRQTVIIDEVKYTIGENVILPIMMNQTFVFERRRK